MKNLFTALFRARDKPQDSVSAAPVFYFGTSGSGKAVTVQIAIQLSTVDACIRVISETAASLPLGVYETTDEGNQKATDRLVYLSEDMRLLCIDYFRYLCNVIGDEPKWFFPGKRLNAQDPIGDSAVDRIGMMLLGLLGICVSAVLIPKRKK